MEKYVSTNNPWRWWGYVTDLKKSSSQSLPSHGCFRCLDDVLNVNREDRNSPNLRSPGNKTDSCPYPSNGGRTRFPDPLNPLRLTRTETSRIDFRKHFFSLINRTFTGYRFTTRPVKHRKKFYITLHWKFWPPLLRVSFTQKLGYSGLSLTMKRNTKVSDTRKIIIVWYIGTIFSRGERF